MSGGHQKETWRKEVTRQTRKERRKRELVRAVTNTLRTKTAGKTMAVSEAETLEKERAQEDGGRDIRNTDRAAGGPGLKSQISED